MARKSSVSPENQSDPKLEAQRNRTLDSNLSSPSRISTRSPQSRISTILSSEVGFDSHLNLRSLSCFHSIFLVLCELFLDL
ncbi:unnamed protein product, partial [Vitis vinifera]|uniref:Uncharacterized protein n=1 Tax=Vitis vinifera TaxID=29760 RepID=D7U3S3_VITVI